MQPPKNLDNTQEGLFAEENGHNSTQPAVDRALWKVMVVDDEEEVHNVTRLVLGHMTFHGQAIEIINCNSGKEAMEKIKENPDVALMLLDVVMETEDAGLQVVRYVRDDLKNHFVRIVLRTGQPGQAPEKEVIEKYDINDYKDKTELTSQKLYTLVLTSIRSYRDIMVIEHNKRGLYAIILASQDIFQLRSMNKFAKAVLDQMTSLLQLEANALYCKTDTALATSHSENSHKAIQIVVATGAYKDLVGHQMNGGIEQNIKDHINEVLKEKKNISRANEYYAYFQTHSGEEHVLFVKFQDEKIELSQVDHELIDLFCKNVALGFENIYRYNQLIVNQGEMICRLSEILESKAEHLGERVRRIAKVAECLAKGKKLNEKEVETIRIVAPLHDISEFALSKELLEKTEDLSEKETKEFFGQEEIDQGLLNEPKSHVLRTAVTVARHHNEKWDGSGYPEKLKGDQIDLAARITRVADTFDGLLTDTNDGKPWTPEKVVNYFTQERGKTFDPELVDILLTNKDTLFALYS